MNWTGVMGGLEQIEREIPALRGFAQRYREDIRPQLQTLETQRILGYGAFVLGMAFVGLGLFTVGGKSLVDALGTAFILGGIGLCVVSVRHISALNRRGKVLLAERACAMLGLHYTLKPKRGYTDQFHQLYLLPTHQTYVLEDEISGQVGRTGFVLQEVQLRWGPSPVLTNIWVDRSKSVFRGLVGVIEYPGQARSAISRTVAMRPMSSWMLS